VWKTGIKTADGGCGGDGGGWLQISCFCADRHNLMLNRTPL